MVAASGELWDVSPANNEARVVARGVDVRCGLSWSPRAIVFCRAGELGDAPGGGEERQLTSRDLARDETSHETPVIVDDQLVLFSSVASETGGERIEAVPLEGGGRAVVVERAMAPMNLADRTSAVHARRRAHGGPVYSRALSVTGAIPGDRFSRGAW